MRALAIVLLLATSARAELLQEVPVGSGTTVSVYAHEIESCGQRIPLWSYVTRGLVAHGQAELVFSLRRGDDEGRGAFPQDPVSLLRTIAYLAAQGQIVVEGGLTGWDGERTPFLGERRLNGAIYAAAGPLAGVPLPADALTMIIVYDDELNIIQKHGSARVLGRLAESQGCPPHPVWLTRGRLPVFTDHREPSYLDEVGPVLGNRIGILQEPKGMVLRIVEADHARIASTMARAADNVSFATRQDPTADGWLTWNGAEQKQPIALTRPGSRGRRVAGNFVSLGGGVELFRVVEDGFVILMPTGHWKQFRRALIDKKPLRLPAEGKVPSLRLEWVAR